MNGTCRCPGCGYPNYLSELRLFQAETDPVHCWHCEAFIDHREVELTDVVANRFQHLAGQRIVMIASGIEYRGVFVEMTDEDVKIRGDTGWIILDMHLVSRVFREGDKPEHPRAHKMIDRSFYEIDDLVGEPADDEDYAGDEPREESGHD